MRRALQVFRKSYTLEFMEDDDLLIELAQAFLSVGWEHIEQEVIDCSDDDKISLLLDAGVEFLTKLIATHRTIHPLDDTHLKLEEIIADLRGGCFHTPYVFDEYLN